MDSRAPLCDHIIGLCHQAVATDDLAALNGVLEQLRAALHQHSEYLRQLAEEKLTPIVLLSAVVHEDVGRTLEKAVRTDTARD
jgi:hypothetical protein